MRARGCRRRRGRRSCSGHPPRPRVRASSPARPRTWCHRRVPLRRPGSPPSADRPARTLICTMVGVGVLEHVHQRLLADPVCRDLDRGGKRRQAVGHVHPSLHQLAELGRAFLDRGRSARAPAPAGAARRPGSGCRPPRHAGCAAACPEPARPWPGRDAPGHGRWLPSDRRRPAWAPGRRGGRAEVGGAPPPGSAPVARGPTAGRRRPDAGWWSAGRCGSRHRRG